MSISDLNQKKQPIKSKIIQKKFDENLKKKKRDEKKSELFKTIPKDAYVIFNINDGDIMMIDSIRMEKYIINIKKNYLETKKIHIIFYQEQELSDLSKKIAQKHDVIIHCLPPPIFNPTELYFGKNI